MRKLKNVLFYLTLLFAIGVYCIFKFTSFTILSDSIGNTLLLDCIERFVLLAFLLSAIWNYPIVHFKLRPIRIQYIPLLLSSLCVSLANFPLHALLTGTAQILYAKFTLLFILDCFFIAITEELVFTGILFSIFMGKCKRIFATLLTACCFSLIHALNLFSGASVGGTLLQLGYSFLISCLLTTCYSATKTIWIPILFHFLFDIGGTIVLRLGTGTPQDSVFWIHTIVCGCTCGVFVLFNLLSKNQYKEGINNESN